MISSRASLRRGRRTSGRRLLTGSWKRVSDAIPALVAGLEHGDPLVRHRVPGDAGEGRQRRSGSVGTGHGAFLRKPRLRTPQKEAAWRALEAIDPQALASCGPCIPERSCRFRSG